MIVILNPNAGAGTARAKWTRLEPLIRDRLGPFKLVVTTNASAVDLVVAEALRNGESEFVPAGG
ncbi:MAG: hypothetical protein JSW46_00685, partial [Gemmatimonadota bacterium]